MDKKIPHLEDLIGNTPLIATHRISAGKNNKILLKLEMQNPSASVKARAAYNMIKKAIDNDQIKDDTYLVEATSGNTGIAMAMVAAIHSIPIKLIMPENSTQERKDLMRAYGAELIEVTQEEGIEGARDLAEEMSKDAKAVRLDQFANQANPDMHYATTGPEIWEQTDNKLTHFISSMGTTGTITGCSRFFKEQNPDIQVIGLQPCDGENIPGIRKWPKEYIPSIFKDEHIDRILEVDIASARAMTQRLAREEGVLSGLSSGAALHAGVEIAKESEDAVIAVIICDTGERYISTDIFSP